MKRIWSVFLVLVFITGCAAGEGNMEQVLSLRSKLSGGCSFRANITADYADVIYQFVMDCRYDPSGNLSFEVVEPASIAGISGKISATGGALTFDDALLAFELMADGQLSPVAAPWVIIKALHSGYITSCGYEGSYIRASIRDSYADDAFDTDIWITKEEIPVRGEILWKNRRILAVEVINFTFG